jgi:nucleotide-binding universal stress UspA family protein
LQAEESAVFQHILLPTDGSAASQSAAAACIRFAASVGARVTALHVVAPLHLFTYEPQVTEQAHAAYRRKRDARAQQCLAPVSQLAAEAKVPCNTILAEADDASEAIVRTAHEQMCDVIAMAKHGRRGVRGLLLGSVTHKVLTHGALPVLILH